MKLSHPEVEFIIVDLFCGAGGTTTGFSLVPDNKAKVVACINHDPIAIKSHWVNHPEVKHFEEDIRTLDLTELIRVVNFQRSKFPNAKLILWASLECTNFSKAKGGLPREADSRTLAESLYSHWNPETKKYEDRHSYIQMLNPDYVMIENVVEFMSWGPLDKNGKPVNKKKGSDWMKWREKIKSLGYYDDWAELNSANYGAYTSRNRLFGIFAKPDLPIAWPTATHSKNPDKLKDLYDQPLLKWKACRPCLKLDLKGESIFGRKKRLSTKTMQRVFMGLLKFVGLTNEKEFLVKYNSTSSNGTITGASSSSVESPSPTIATQDRLAICQPDFMVNYNHSSNANDIDQPSPSLVTKDRLALVQSEFISNYKSGSPQYKNHSLNKPAGTITTNPTQALVQTEFLALNYSNGGNLSSTEKPCPTLSTKDRVSIVSPQYIMRDFTNGGSTSSIDAPAGTIMANPKMNLVSPEPFMINQNFSNGPTSIDAPAQTITANRKWQYLVNPQWLNSGHSLDKPCFTLIARMDKAPPYLVTTETGEAYIEAYDDDCEYTKRIKYFMAEYGILDIKMRMLLIDELKVIQGFPEDYHLSGTKQSQKKFIGNSVVPNVVTVWTTSLIDRITGMREQEQLTA